jgi:hypothetical protein
MPAVFLSITIHPEYAQDLKTLGFEKVIGYG